MKKKIKVWIYLWPQDKKLTDGQICFKKAKKESVASLKLREYCFELTEIKKLQ